MPVPKIAVQDGPVLEDAYAAEIASRRPLDPALHAQIEIDLQMGLKGVELLPGPQRQLGRMKQIIHWTVKVFGPYKPAESKNKIEKIIEESIKRYTNFLRKVRRREAKEARRQIKAERRPIKLSKSRQVMEHQAKHVTRTSLIRSDRARHASRALALR